MRKIDRFDKYMKHNDLNDNKVTVALNLSVGTLGKSRKEGRDLSDKVVEKILNFYADLNRVWLLTGEGEMVKLDSETTIQDKRPKQLESDFSIVAEACQKAANAAEESARTTRILAEGNSRVLNQIVESITRIEQKIDQKGAAADVEGAAQKAARG